MQNLCVIDQKRESRTLATKISSVIGGRDSRSLKQQGPFLNAKNSLKEIQTQDQLMPLLPRWQYMTDESKSMVKKVGFSALAMIFVMGIVRALLPLAVVGVGGYWAYKFLSKKQTLEKYFCFLSGCIFSMFIAHVCLESPRIDLLHNLILEKIDDLLKE